MTHNYIKQNDNSCRIKMPDAKILGNNWLLHFKQLCVYGCKINSKSQEARLARKFKT